MNTENTKQKNRNKVSGRIEGPVVTPTEYIIIEQNQKAIIKAAQKVIGRAREEADKCLPPINRRPATQADIVVGAVIWHEREDEYGGDYWHIVDELQYPGDAWKAYVADDGCRYGLDGAYVESSQRQDNASQKETNRS